MNSLKRILIADDNPRVLTLLTAVLHNHYEVTCVADGVALEGELIRNSYDLVITDLQMPKRPGLVALRRFEQHCTASGRAMVPVIIITGKDGSDPAVIVAREMSRVRAVFHKPFDLRLLAERIGDVLGGPRARLTSGVRATLQNPPTVLVVDDDEEVAECVAAQLEEEGYMTHCNTDPAAALQNCKQFKYDLIILDYVLGDIQCDEWLTKLYATLPQKWRPPVLIVTGFGDIVTREQFNQWPTVRAILSKPFEPEELSNEVRACLSATARDPESAIATVV